MGLWSDFKSFAIKGNMLDLAIGVVVGGAFGKIINSLVADIIMPPIAAYVLGTVNFSDMKIPLKPESVDATGKAVPAITLNYGSFLQITFEFFVIAFSIFMFIKLIERMKKAAAKEEAVAEAAAPPAPAEDVVLLTEIRDLLKNKQ